MDYFSLGGFFWVVDRPGRRVPGTLSFDASGVALTVRLSLLAVAEEKDQVIDATPRWTTIPLVQGQLYDGRGVTLLNASGIDMRVPDSDTSTVEEVWRAGYSLLNGQIESDQFDHASFEFDYLAPWADPPGITSEGPHRNCFVTHTDRITIDEVNIDEDTQLSLRTGVVGNSGSDQIHLDQWCRLEVAGPPLPLQGLLTEWVRPLQDLLIVCLGRPVRLTGLSVRPPNAAPRTDALSVSFAAVQPPPTAPPSKTEIRNYDRPTLVTYRDCPLTFGDLIRNWFRVYEAERDVLALLCGPMYAPFIFGEHRYASTFQGAEALAKSRYAGKQLTRQEHRKRVEDVVEVLSGADLDAGVVTWARSVIASRNDKSLREVVQELTESVDAVGYAILNSCPDFPKRVVAARTGVSHGGASGGPAITRHWLGEALIWILRISLLVESGIPLSWLTARVLRKEGFKRVLRELASLPAA